MENTATFPRSPDVRDDGTSTVAGGPIQPAPPPFTLPASAPYHVLSQFCPDALELRAAFETHFADPYRRGPQHQVWDYWHVPDSYTYLRTSPEKVLPRVPLDAFHAQLRAFARTWLGMDTVTWPHLSLYVEGCRQTIHNDSSNGAFGYVFSLTLWDQRKFTGGETMIFREQDYWASGRFREAGAGTSFYEIIPSVFNQLLLFDDRLIHGVQEVRGVTDPRFGRLVVHGHLQCKEPAIDGPLAQAPRDVAEPLAAIVRDIRSRAASLGKPLHGFATTAIRISAEGDVVVTPQISRVLSRDGVQGDIPLLVEMRERLSELRFPAMDHPSFVTVPILFS
jgi:Rps23 Pro-64 3,4-dihydroxylase Tpa1-like proline 4-hydroxylase